LAVLGSGSRGNAVVVDSGAGAILLDAGFSCRQIELRLATLGIEAGDLIGVFVTHEHSDHVQGLQLLCRRYGLPFWASRGTLEGIDLHPQLEGSARILDSCAKVEIGPFQVESFAIPHDARDPVGLVVEDRHGRRVGLAADMGCQSQLAWTRLQGLDALLIETNHDLEMLRRGPYPWHLKERISGRHGHLSNREALEGLEALVHERLRHVVAYHLSGTNNSPTLVEALLAERLLDLGSRASVTVAEQNQPTAWMQIGVAP
jgi:phosphoribosyl 1,2-cyclic phosphodiesterase